MEIENTMNAEKEWYDQEPRPVPETEEAESLSGIENVLLLTMSFLPKPLVWKPGEAHRNPLRGNSNEYDAGILENREEAVVENTKEKRTVYGYGQMEPLPKLLLQEGKSPLLIIVMASDEAGEKYLFGVEKPNGEKELRNGSAVDFFVEQVSEFANEVNAEVKFRILRTGSRSDLMIRKAVLNAVEMIRSVKECNLYLDIHGGLREDQTVVEAIVNMLRIDGIHLKAAFSIAYPGAPIKRVDSSLEIFDFVSGMNEFISYGRAGTLGRFFGENEKFVEDIANLANRIQTCDILGVRRTLGRIPGEMEQFEQEEDNEKNILLRIFAETIRNDYRDADLWVESGEDGDELSDFCLLKWCLEKEFYQQALTIVESRIPTFLMENCMTYSVISGESQEYSRKSDPDKIEKLLKNAGMKDWMLPDNYVLEQFCQSNILQRSGGTRKFEYCSLKPGKLEEMQAFWKDGIRDGSEWEFTLRNGLKVKIMVDEGVDRRDLNRFLQLHMALKNQRNIANHASVKEHSDRRNAKDIYQSMEVYVRWLEEIAA